MVALQERGEDILVEIKALRDPQKGAGGRCLMGFAH